MKHYLFKGLASKSLVLNKKGLRGSTIIKGFSIAAALVLSTGAYANMSLADNAYDTNDFNTAITEYKKSAQVGMPRAMHTIATMYYKGQGVTADKIKASAWFLLAAQYNFANSEQVSQSIIASLTDTQKQTLSELINQLVDDYDANEIANNFYPNLKKSALSQTIKIGETDSLLGLEDDDGLTDDLFSLDIEEDLDLFEEEDEFGDPLSSPSANQARKPTNLSQRPYYVIAEYVIAPDGTVRDIEVLQSFGFIGTAMRKFRQVKYPAPTFNDKPVTVHRRISLGLAQQNLSKLTLAQDYHFIYRGIKDTLSDEKTNSTNPYDQYKYALTLMNFEGLWRKDNQVNDLLKSASEQGLVEAQFVYANKLYREQTDIKTATKWMLASAKQGLANAEYRIGDMLLNSPWIVRDEQKAAFWLDKAAEQGHVFALRKSAELKLFAKDKTLLDPATALTQLKRLEIVERQNPEVKFLTAIAWERQDKRNRKESVNMLRNAIFLGDQQGWDTDAWSDVLTRWTSGGNVTISESNH